MKKTVVILGAGTAGTMVANGLSRRLPSDWSVALVEPDPIHLYQPSLLFLPFGAREGHDMIRTRLETLGDGVNWRLGEVARVDSHRRLVILQDASEIYYDYLVIATGSRPRPELTEGFFGDYWRRTIFDFYTLEGALALRAALSRLRGGRLVVSAPASPVKSPTAGLEFLFLADEYFARRHSRERIELVYVTGHERVHEHSIANEAFVSLCASRGIEVVTGFSTVRADGEAGCLVSSDQRIVSFDTLVTIPVHTGAEFIRLSGLGNQLDFVPTDEDDLSALDVDRTYVLGDATDLDVSKLASVARFQGEILLQNLPRVISGKEVGRCFDGHASWLVETGYEKALAMDSVARAGVEPAGDDDETRVQFTLVQESKRNHWDKLFARWVYWNRQLPAMPLEPDASPILAERILAEAGLERR